MVWSQVKGLPRNWPGHSDTNPYRKERVNVGCRLSCLPLTLVTPSTPAMSAGRDHSMLHMPIWTAQVAMHVAWPFKNRLSDSGPAIGLLWRSSGKDYQGELFFFWLLVLRQGDRDGLREKMRENKFLQTSFLWLFSYSISFIHSDPKTSKHSLEFPKSSHLWIFFTVLSQAIFSLPQYSQSTYPAEGDGMVGLGKATGQGLRGCQLGTWKFMRTLWTQRHEVRQENHRS